MALIVFVLASFLFSGACSAGFVTVQTSFGPVVGESGPLASAFRGIPFAKPPVGSLRWASPVFPDKWILPRNVSGDFTPSCPQDCEEPSIVCPTTFDEDCLTLNVFVPSLKSPTELPVMLFWSGGNYKEMGAGSLLYEGDYFANFTNVVVVTANYRLGALGYAVTEKSLTGDYGTEDQALAMQWVQLNAKAFGGDPQRVTIFGQSAGAGSVAAHLVSPRSAGLFQRGIMQSNPYSIEYKNVSVAADVGKLLLKHLVCEDDIDCLRERTWQDVLKAQLATEPEVIPFPKPYQAAYVWSPTVGGKFLSEQPLQSVISGNFTKVPIVLGTLRDEGVAFVFQLFPKPVTKDETALLLPAIYGDDAAEKIWKMYPIPSNQTEDTRFVLSTIVTHYTFSCSSRYVARALGESVPVYLYYYDHVLSYYQAWDNDTYCYSKVCHAAELPVEWQTAPLAGYQPTADEIVLGNRLLHFWSLFAYGATEEMPSLDPLSPSWPLYSAVVDQSMQFDTPNTTVQVNRNLNECDMWDSIGYLNH